jgi:hypothetical protein
MRLTIISMAFAAALSLSLPLSAEQVATVSSTNQTATPVAETDAVTTAEADTTEAMATNMETEIVTPAVNKTALNDLKIYPCF